MWDGHNTVVVSSHRGHLGHKTIKEYIRREGAALPSLLEAHGNRYDVVCEDVTDNNERVKELFEKIDALVAENGFYEIDGVWKWTGS